MGVLHLYLGVSYQGILAGIFSVLSNEYVVTVGASGVFFGLVSMLFYVKYAYQRELPVVMISKITPVIAVLIVNFLVALNSQNIDLYSHIGGIVGGLFFILILTRFWTKKYS